MNVASLFGMSLWRAASPLSCESSYQTPIWVATNHGGKGLRLRCSYHGATVLPS